MWSYSRLDVRLLDWRGGAEVTVRTETLKSVPTVWSQTHNAISSTSSSFPVTKTPDSWSRSTTNRLRGSAHNRSPEWQLTRQHAFALNSSSRWTVTYPASTRSSSSFGVSSPKPSCSHLTVAESFPTNRTRKRQQNLFLMRLTELLIWMHVCSTKLTVNFNFNDIVTALFC